ncbi:MAG: hypothetical protein SGI73_19795 [Chloroflexota bacterium]|nr:hypothetical protein [Chloroflexota bacterium]
MRINRLFLPAWVGVLLGFIQTGLFLQLAFTLSSSITTYLMITLCWLVGSVFGVLVLAQRGGSLARYLLIAMLAYGACGVMLVLQPFETRLLPLYGVAIILIGVYPGVFFQRMTPLSSARTVFFLENNGFIVGIIVSTIAFMFFGQVVLWIVPVVISLYLAFMTKTDARSLPAHRPSL